MPRLVRGRTQGWWDARWRAIRDRDYPHVTALDEARWVAEIDRSLREPLTAETIREALGRIREHVS
jgi:hypothetical protein